MVAVNAIACDNRHSEHMDYDVSYLHRFDWPPGDGTRYSVSADGLDIDMADARPLIMGLRFLIYSKIQDLFQ